MFYEVCMDIVEGSELFVWYGDIYFKYMGILIIMKIKLIKIENDGGFGKYIICIVCVIIIFKIKY